MFALPKVLGRGLQSGHLIAGLILPPPARHRGADDAEESRGMERPLQEGDVAERPHLAQGRPVGSGPAPLMVSTTKG